MDSLALAPASPWSFSAQIFYKESVKSKPYFQAIYLYALTSNACNLSHHGSVRRQPIRQAFSSGVCSQTANNDSCLDLPADGVFCNRMLYVIWHSSTNASISSNACCGCRYTHNTSMGSAAPDSLRISRITCSTRCSSTVQSLPPLNEMNISSHR